MPAFHIRPATHADIPAIEHLIEASVRGLQKDDHSPAVIEGALGYAFSIDTQLIEDGTYFVAESIIPTDPADSTQTTLAGSGGWSYRQTLCGGDHAPKRALASLNPATDFAKIRAIFVHPGHARRGLGTLILEHCEQAAANAGFRKFEMGSTLTGVRLYERKGYQPQERLDMPLPTGEILPILRMTKTLETGPVLSPALTASDRDKKADP